MTDRAARYDGIDLDEIVSLLRDSFDGDAPVARRSLGRDVAEMLKGIAGWVGVLLLIVSICTAAASFLGLLAWLSPWLAVGFFILFVSLVGRF